MEKENSLVLDLSLDNEAVNLADRDMGWHFVTCGVIMGSGGC